MRTCWKSAEELLFKFNKRVQDYGPQYFLFGIFGVINYPTFYIIWSYYSLQQFENLTLRVAATVLSIPLLFVKFWPSRLKVFLPAYYYLTLTFCLPFFFTYLLLMNDFSDVWLMATTITIMWLMLLVDWVSFVILLVLGTVSAYLLYHFTKAEPFPEGDYLGLVLQYLGSLAVVLIFAGNKERILKTKFQTAKTMAAAIAHEVRTPLRSIDAGIQGVQHYLPDLVQSYEIAKKRFMKAC
jgi:two-component system CAI-1 autoinducer sensor kinase/phosphatase CqsS